jgi:hypothetical protein
MGLVRDVDQHRPALGPAHHRRRAAFPHPEPFPEPSHTPAATPPERLLAERFARGEIDEEEYRRRLAVLRGNGPNLAKH